MLKKKVKVKDKVGKLSRRGTDVLIGSKIRITPVGLKVKGELTKSEWSETGQILVRLEGSLAWAIGDWARLHCEEYGDLKSFAEENGLNYQSVRAYKRLVDNYPELGMRIPNLGFQHHQLMATSDYTPEERQEWLEKAANERWSVAEFRKGLKAWQRQRLLGECGNIDRMARVELGDFREKMEEIDDSSVSLIFTDPPYNEESIEFYDDLAELASRKLVEGGSLLSYVGHYAIDRVLNGMNKSLRFWWLIAIEHSGASARLPGKWVFVEWKPILWFVRSGRLGKEYVADLFRSEQPDKKHHDWEQDTSEAEYYIEQLTKPGDLVVDPFLGGGTTGIAALNRGRQFWGCEIDPNTKRIAEHRLADWKCSG